MPDIPASTRDARIDLLRALGVLLLVLAHVGPPAAVFQVRNFDVPLLVLLAGASYGLSGAATEPYGRYLWRRTKHLLGPVWGFLTGYFLLLWLTDFPVPLPNPERLLKSYLLLGGIGYVWIFRVFLMMAVVSPPLWWGCRRLSGWALGAGVLLLLGLHEAGLLLLPPYLHSVAGQLVALHAFYLLPYAGCLVVGMKLPALSRWQVGVMAVVLIGLLLVTAVALDFPATQYHKYPPRSYYILYGLAVATALWWATSVAQLEGQWLRPLRFISRHSLWFYLWHIPLVELIAGPWWGRWPAVVLGAGLLTWATQAIKRNPRKPSASPTNSA